MREQGLSTSKQNSTMMTCIVEPWMPLTPKRTTKRLRYSDGSYTLTATSGAPATYVFAANDCFDPNVTGTGHQPMGFDQMMQLYNHFCVVSAKLIVTYRNLQAGSNPTVCLRYDGSATPLTVIPRIVELGGNVMALLEAGGVTGCNKTLDLKLDVAKLQGVSRATITADDQLRGSAGASPLELTYFHCVLWDADATTASCLIDIVLEQEVIFSEPRDNIES